MERLTATYSSEEDAWVTPEVILQRDIYLMITLKKKGKLVIRQETADGKMPRVPLKRHKDTKAFTLRISVIPDTVRVQIYTSTEPEEIKYAYI